MAERPWEDLTDEELEHLLVERWLYRGGVLAMAFTFGVLITVLAARGVSSLADQVLVGLLVFFALLTAGVFVYLRVRDHRIYRALRERRRNAQGPPS